MSVVAAQAETRASGFVEPAKDLFAWCGSQDWATRAEKSRERENGLLSLPRDALGNILGYLAQPGQGLKLADWAILSQVCVEFAIESRRPRDVSTPYLTVTVKASDVCAIAAP